MSIQSLGSLYGPSVLTPRTPPREGAREPVRQGPIDVPVPQEAGRTADASHAVSLSGELPVEAPPGTDPDLWSVLTSEERRFFAQARAMGPVTYGRGNLGLAELGLHRGVRLDVRV